MRKPLAALVAASLAVIALAAPVGAITYNAQRDFEHDFVGLLVFYTTPDPETGDPFSHRCSGTLISPTIVVTAGHCTEGVDEGRIYFEQALGPNYSPDAFGGWGGDETTGYPYENGHTFSRADNYGNVGFPDTKDAGVVVLDEPYTPPSGRFGQLPEPGLVDDLLAAAGNNDKQDVRFRTVGYGLVDQDPVADPGLRERLSAWGYLIESTNPLTQYNLKTTNNPAKGKGGSCNGDSGGPVFVEGTDVIAAVVSFGWNPQCKGQDYSYRLDREPVLDWILDADRPDAG
jgi:V8-like Glu-specific endopeptidase